MDQGKVDRDCAQNLSTETVHEAYPFITSTLLLQPQSRVAARPASFL